MSELPSLVIMDEVEGDKMGSFEELTNALSLATKHLVPVTPGPEDSVISMPLSRVKICGITQPEQGQAIAQLGASSIGFICVRKSPRYVTPDQIRSIGSVLPAGVDRVGVFMDHAVEEVIEIVQRAGLTSVQLHGDESIEFCQTLRSRFDELMPNQLIEFIKAFRIRSAEDLEITLSYQSIVDWLLLDAYHPQMGGGTGLTLDWESLKKFKPDRPWLLAGGLTPDNIQSALSLIQPDGVDLSSGVERSPGDKDLEKVKLLFEQLQSMITDHDCITPN